MAVLCVLLLAAVSLEQIVHVHPSGSKTPAHNCSICSATHTSVRAEASYVPGPQATSREIALSAEESPLNLLVVSSLFIRPPPAV